MDIYILFWEKNLFLMAFYTYTGRINVPGK